MAERAYVQPDVIITNGPYVDARAYGTAKTDVTIQAALTAIGAADRVLFISPTTWTLSNDVTVPANVTLSVPQGATISVDNGKTLTINGHVNAGAYQIFAGAGTTTVSTYPQDDAWWGSTQSANFNRSSILLLSENSNNASIANHLVLTTADERFQFLQSDSTANISVDLPSEGSSTGIRFWINNSGEEGYGDIYVYGSDSVTLISIITPGSSCIHCCDGTEWKSGFSGSGSGISSSLKNIIWDADAKVWMYRNDTANGMLIDTSAGIKGMVLALRGTGAGDEYTATGGTTDGAWTHTHSDTFNTNVTVTAHAKANMGTGGQYFPEDGNFFVDNNHTVGQGITGSITANTAFRPAAAVGTLQYPDIS